MPFPVCTPRVWASLTVVPSRAHAASAWPEFCRVLPRMSKACTTSRDGRKRKFANLNVWKDRRAIDRVGQSTKVDKESANLVLTEILGGFCPLLALEIRKMGTSGQCREKKTDMTDISV